MHFSDSYYIASCHASYRVPDADRRVVNRALREYTAPMKLDHRFRKDPAGLKAALAKVEEMKKALADFPDFDKLDISQSEGFSMGF